MKKTAISISITGILLLSTVAISASASAFYLIPPAIKRQTNIGPLEINRDGLFGLRAAISPFHRAAKLSLVHTQGPALFRKQNNLLGARGIQWGPGLKSTQNNALLGRGLQIFSTGIVNQNNVLLGRGLQALNPTLSITQNNLLGRGHQWANSGIVTNQLNIGSIGSTKALNLGAYNGQWNAFSIAGNIANFGGWNHQVNI